MPSTLLLSAVDVPFNSLWLSPAAAADEDLNEYNLMAKNRYSMFQFNAAASTNSIRFDLGSSATKAVDHLIVARADILKTAGMTTLNLAGGSDGSTFGTTALNNTSFSSQTLYGPRSDDYVVEISTTTALRWWRLTYTNASGSQKFCHSAASFGTWFDFGCEVGKYEIDRIPARNGEFYADSGALLTNRVNEEIYRFKFTWNVVTVAKATNFMQNIARYAHRIPVFLYTTTAGNRHELLDSQRLIHCRILPDSIRVSNPSQKYNRQEVTIEFEELLG